MLSYFFSTAPGSVFKYYIPLFILIGILILGSIIFSFYYKQKKKTDFAFKRLFKQFGNRLLIFGILYLFLIIVRFENIPYFSMRIWLYLTTLALLYLVVYKYLKSYFISYPKEKQNQTLHHQKVQREEKIYLPHKKKRR